MSKPKQTTIRIEIEEAISGATVIPLPARGSRHEYTPTHFETLLWENIVTNAKWEYGKPVAPKDDKPDDATWWKELCARIVRVCQNRPTVKTKVRVAKTFPNGNARIIVVTAYWHRIKNKPTTDTSGVWTLKEHRHSSDNQGKILHRIHATLECDGDDLYCHLPEGGIPDGYDTYPDVGDIYINPVDWRNGDPRKWWSFKFRQTVKPRQHASITIA